MVDLFKMEDTCDKYFKEGNYAPTVENTTNKKTEKAFEDEEVVHIEDEIPKEEPESVPEKEGE